jgi:hypothetical protein
VDHTDCHCYTLVKAYAGPIETIAVEVFNKGIIIAPTVALLAVLPPLKTERAPPWRTMGVLLCDRDLQLWRRVTQSLVDYY